MFEATIQEPTGRLEILRALSNDGFLTMRHEYVLSRWDNSILGQPTKFMSQNVTKFFQLMPGYTMRTVKGFVPGLDPEPIAQDPEDDEVIDLTPLEVKLIEYSSLYAEWGRMGHLTKTFPDSDAVEIKEALWNIRRKMRK